MDTELVIVVVMTALLVVALIIEERKKNNNTVDNPTDQHSTDSFKKTSSQNYELTKTRELPVVDRDL